MSRYITVVSITSGVITGVDEEGNICTFLQEGVYGMDKQKRDKLISIGLISCLWNLYDEIPSGIELTYENEERVGCPSRRYPDIDIAYE